MNKHETFNFDMILYLRVVLKNIIESNFLPYISDHNPQNLPGKLGRQSAICWNSLGLFRNYGLNCWRSKQSRDFLGFYALYFLCFTKLKISHGYLMLLWKLYHNHFLSPLLVSLNLTHFFHLIQAQFLPIYFLASKLAGS